ncbi:MAG: AMIN domain-containing protein [Candidatus Latescibacterota bacterium]|nr:MAG: AMIN domain-containing protein [Candidatus Latescibacterota bacterium]
MTQRAHGMRVAVLAGLWLLVTTAVSAKSLKEVEIRGVGDGTRIVMDLQGEVSHKSFTLPNPDRVVLDLVGVKNDVKVGLRSVPGGPVRQLRLAQFASEPEMVTRLVADLRQPSTHKVERVGDKLVLVVMPTAGASAFPAPDVVLENTPGTKTVTASSSAEPRVQDMAMSTAVEDAAAPMPEMPSAEAPVVAEPPVVAQPEKVAEAEAFIDASRDAMAEMKPVPDVAPPAEPAPSLPPAMATPTQSSARVSKGESAPVKTPEPARQTSASPRLQSDFFAMREDTTPDTPPVVMQETRGRRINLDLQGADIRTVLRTLADYSGRNIIAAKEVQGEVSARIQDAPWRDALASILKAHGYGYVEENGIIRVGELAKIRTEELEEKAAERKRDDLLPIVTEIVPLHFADAGELKGALQEMKTPRGRMQVDQRTNSLIVSDIPNKVQMIAQMARELDSRTPQVEIVSKLVDVSADDSENLGINWSITNLTAGEFIGGAGVNAPTPGAVGGIRVGTVQSWAQLDMMLDALARTQRANIVSNPNITTVNNREAKILVGAKIPLIVADEAGNAITQLTTVGIQMRVTPHVNSDRTITLDLHPEVSELSSQATVQGGVIINTSEADTRVIVEDGETAIIGGLIRDVESEVKVGIPVLQDLPGLGWMFGSRNRSHDKRELIIFVTPRLIEADVSLNGETSGVEPR